MITGLPNYKGAIPIEYSIRCGLCYVIFIVAVIVGDAEVKDRERARVVYIEVMLESRS